MSERPLRVPQPHTAIPLPASGAWKPGDPVANRKFFLSGKGREHGRPFALEGGGKLDEVSISYETWGELNAEASNAILICHALTGDAHVAGQSGPGQPTPGWWDPLVGPGKAIDTSKYFVVCSNVLGGCQGTTGPASPHPDDGDPYGSRFPMVTIRDMVRAQQLLSDHLGVDQWFSVVGGSMGGMLVLEWAVMFPERVHSAAVISSAAAASPMQIGWSEVGRLAVAQDPRWNGGDYYDAAEGEGPHEGFMLARRIAQIHYRSDESFASRFGRSTVEASVKFDLWGRFQVESYLDYHGQKLVRRFDANSYLILNKALDLHDVGRGRGGVDEALSRISASILVGSVDTDILYPPRQQYELRDALENVGVDTDFAMIESPHGHDGFLVECNQLTPIIENFLTKQQR